MFESITNVVVVALLAVLLLVVLVMAIRIVPEYQRLVVFRLGRLLGEKGPGLVLLIPFIDRGVRVDLREWFFDVPPQTTITEDNAHLSIDFLVYTKITEAIPSVINVENYEGASRGIAITTLRAVVGSMILDDVLAKREEINEALRGKLDEVTNRWGIKVTAVEIREITPPREIQEAMSRQMSAERSRRAMVLEADGKREAAVREAEGERQAVVLRAQGDREAAILRAEGFALALEKIFEVAREVDSKTMSLQYLETLKALGAGSATKLVIPAELTNLLQPFLAHNAKSSQ
jgi:regulator of protease activity HflC (stomatin/prohibitin superfamily)